MKDIILFEKEGFICLEKIHSKDEMENKLEGYFIDNLEEKEIRKIVDKNKSNKKILAVQSYGNNLNRRILETMKINYLVFPEKVDKRDNLKQRDSGINHVTAKIAKDKNISFLLNFSELLEINGKERALVFSRIIQNLKICRKAGATIKIASFAQDEKNMINSKEMQEFLLSLGSSTSQAREAIIY